MDVEVSAEAKDKRLNRLVAITVVVLSIVMGLGNIKDGNLVQAMDQAKADSVDSWNEYQATRTKAQVARTARAEIAILAGATPTPAAAAERMRLDVELAKYAAEAPRLAAQAEGFAARYDAINVHDDQFDAGEALLSTGIAIAAVASLVDSAWVLAIACLFGIGGIAMSVCGFAGLSFHPDALSSFLG